MTQPNLYRPPGAPIADFQAAAPRRVRRISARLLEILMAAAAASMAVGMWRLG